MAALNVGAVSYERGTPVRVHALLQFRNQPHLDTTGCVHLSKKASCRCPFLDTPEGVYLKCRAPGVRGSLCCSTAVQELVLKTRVRTPRGGPQQHGALPTETKVKSGTSHSKSGTSVQLSEGGVCGGHTRSGAQPFPRHTRVRPSRATLVGLGPNELRSYQDANF